MAEQTMKGAFWIPFVPSASLSIGNTINTLINAAGEKAAFILHAPKAGDIAKVGFRTGTVTTGDDVDVRLEGVDLDNGDPNGSLIAANANATQTIDATDDSTWFLTTLTTAPTVTKGQLIAVVIVNGSGGGNMNIVHWGSGWGERGFPYITDYDGSSWTKDDECPLTVFEYSDGSYEFIPGVMPAISVPSSAFNSGSNPDRRGLRFQLPFPFRITGYWFYADLDGNIDVKLYDSDGTTVLSTMSMDSNVRGNTSRRFFTAYFDDTNTLSKDTNYRIVLQPTTGTNFTPYYLDVDAVAIMDTLEGGRNFHYTTANGNPTVEGDWTQTTTRRPVMGILVDAFDDGVGGGGATGSAIYRRMGQQ